MNITKDIFYVGVNDHDIDLFEGQYVVPKGMSYNSYLIVDEKTAVFDTVDARFTDAWLANIRAVLGDRAPDYLIVQHMEPDHSANIANFLNTYPTATVVATARACTMMGQFFGTDYADRRIVAAEGSTLNLGTHALTFVTAPMVHWPEVMVTYDSTDRVLFSADGFGKFGAFDADEPWTDEFRRYYIGIVGKYGMQVQALLKKAAKLDIAMICPLHGPVLSENLGEYLRLYDLWSSYTPESDDICVCYTSVYGNTKKAVLQLVEKLREAGQNVVVYDLARSDMSAAVADAFRCAKVVLATTTYNAEIFPFMNDFIHHLTERNFQNRTIGLIENGSWAPMAAKTMREMLAQSKALNILDPVVTIKSALNEQSAAQLDALCEALCRPAAAASAEAAEGGKKFVCKVCGYTYTGESLPEGFTCPLCKRPATAFVEAE